MRYLALGDSYSIGEGVDPADRWPVRLAARLREAGLPVDRPRILATTGWTTDELAAAIDGAQPLGRWDMVSLCIGVNDQYRGRSLADFREQFTALLDTAIGLAGQRPDRLLVASIPDWGVTPFAAREGRDAGGIAREIDAFNATARALCEARGVAFVDITAASRDCGGDAEMLTADELHPSAAMYARWLDVLAPAAQALLHR